MDTSRVSSGEMVAAASGLALFVFMFFPWYGVEVEGLSGIDTPDYHAWESFELVDLLLFLAAAVAIGAAVLRAADLMPDLPAPPATLVMAAGALAVALIVFRIAAPIEGGGTEFLGRELDITRKVGLFLGLLAAAGITYGGFLQGKEPPREVVSEG